jgi:hypothetical protein
VSCMCYQSMQQLHLHWYVQPHPGLSMWHVNTAGGSA